MTPKILARDTAYMPTRALTVSPAAFLATMLARGSAVVFDGRPSGKRLSTAMLIYRTGKYA